jgi:excisionase family DNA binding protein
MAPPERHAATVPAGEPSATLWTAADVAAYLKVSRSWVYHRAEANLLPYVRIGGLLRFEPDAIRQYARDGSSDTQRPRALPLRVRALRKGA